jgi:Fe-S-cluster containining protein
MNVAICERDIRYGYIRFANAAIFPAILTIQKGLSVAAKRTEFGVERTECDCRACVINCRFIPGSLIPADLYRISEYLGESDLTRFALDNLLASPGAIIYTRSGLVGIRTLVPARRTDGACRFLTAEDRCSIHAVAPFSCALFGCKQGREESDALSLRGLMEVASAWQRGDLYAQLWLMLYNAGRIAPSPIEARARMRAAEESAGEDH